MRPARAWTRREPSRDVHAAAAFRTMIDSIGGIAVRLHAEDHWSGQGARLDLRLVGGKPGFPVVFLQGEFDIETVPEIDRFLRRSFGPLFYKRHIVLDLGEVTAVDSIFIGFMVKLVRHLHGERKELVLTRPVGHVRRVLSLIGLPNLVPVYDSLDEAVAMVMNDRLPTIPPAFSAVPAV